MNNSSFNRILLRDKLSDIKLCSAGHICQDKLEMEYENKRKREEDQTIRTVDVPSSLMPTAWRSFNH